MLESETDRLVALGVFAIRNGTKMVKCADGSKMAVENFNKIESRIPQGIERYTGPMPAETDEEYDTLAVDGIAGSEERIANLAQFYRDNGDELDRRGNTIREAKCSPCVLNDDETAERIVSLLPSWAEMPASQRTPFQQLMIELAAEDCLNLNAMQKLIVEQLGS